jgi:hypothetical protein
MYKQASKPKALKDNYTKRALGEASYILNITFLTHHQHSVSRSKKNAYNSPLKGPFETSKNKMLLINTRNTTIVAYLGFKVGPHDNVVFQAITL